MQIKDRIIKRKNFLPTVIVTLFLTAVWILMFFFVPPEQFFMPFLFMFVTFLTCFFASALIFANTRRGLLFSIGVVIFMTLRYFEIGNYLNVLLLSGVILSFEYYFTRQKN